MPEATEGPAPEPRPDKKKGPPPASISWDPAKRRIAKKAAKHAGLSFSRYVVLRVHAQACAELGIKP